MHKLDRAAVPQPACLSGYHYLTHKWSDFGGACKKELRYALFQMQGISGVTSSDAKEYGLRCAYCEGAIRHEGHIEHFRRKSSKHPNGFPHLTFDWDNFFLACGSTDHCGHFKDRAGGPAYDPDDLIKPDIDNPEYYLYFHSSGTVRPRSGLSAEEAHRAGETIRAFGLRDRILEGARAKAVSKYRDMLRDELEEIASWQEDMRREYLLDEIEKTRWEPHSTAIKHFFECHAA